MATSVELQGTFSLAAALSHLFDGDTGGGREGSISYSRTFAVAQGEPEIIGAECFFCAKDVTFATGEWWLAAPTDILQGMGDAKIHDDQTSVGRTIRLFLVVVDDDAAGNLNVKRHATKGPTMWDTADAGENAKAGGIILFCDPGGTLTSALVRDTNDILTITVSGGAVTGHVLIVFGDEV